MSKLLKGSRSRFVVNFFKYSGVILSLAVVSSCSGSGRRSDAKSKKHEMPPDDVFDNEESFINWAKNRGLTDINIKALRARMPEFNHDKLALYKAVVEKECEQRDQVGGVAISDTNVLVEFPYVMEGIEALNNAANGEEVRGKLENLVAATNLVTFSKRNAVKAVVVKLIPKFVTIDGQLKTGNGVVVLSDITNKQGFRTYMQTIKILNLLYGCNHYKIDFENSKVPVTVLMEIEDLFRYRKFFKQKLAIEAIPNESQIKYGFGQNKSKLPWDEGVVAFFSDLVLSCPELLEPTFKNSVSVSEVDLVNGTCIFKAIGKATKIQNFESIRGFAHWLQIGRHRKARQAIGVTLSNEETKIPLDATDGFVAFEKACMELERLLKGYGKMKPVIINFSSDPSSKNIIFTIGKTEVAVYSHETITVGLEKFLKGMDILSSLGFISFGEHSFTCVNRGVSLNRANFLPVSGEDLINQCLVFLNYLGKYTAIKTSFIKKDKSLIMIHYSNDVNNRNKIETRVIGGFFG
ncbi:MAG: hypothetical protein LBD32_00110 [Cytophagales bacterium]|jgi:hypothetical protein|nr:hypothetical protein [Cytophagales bacterium]